MAIGMKMGRTHAEDKETIARVYEKCQEFWDRFEKEFGSHLCFHITGFRLDQEEERKKWLASGGLERCRSIVEKTAKMLCEFIEEDKFVKE